MSAGIRVSAFAGGWDIACGYLWGRDDQFTVTRTLATGLPSPPLELTGAYLRQQVLSLDLAGELAGLGLWAEAALFLPEEKTLVTDLTAVSGPLTTETTRPYFKALAGLDYTFPGGVYVNLQLLHGLFSENSRESLQNYVLAGVERPLAGGRVKLGPLGLALEIDDLRNPGQTWALIVNPELSGRRRHRPRSPLYRGPDGDPLRFGVGCRRALPAVRFQLLTAFRHELPGSGRAVFTAGRRALKKVDNNNNSCYIYVLY